MTIRTMPLSDGKCTFRLLPPVLMLLLTMTGCSELTGQQGWGNDQLGRTYYIDGAGNWGYGVADVVRGLNAAGYRGRIVNFKWSPTFNPALDQTVGRPVARLKAADLAKEINEYCRRFPERQVNMIALSAGTGVAVWACERLEPPARVHSLIMLGSSLSSTYDMTKALRNVDAVFVYYSDTDMILQGPVRTLGTIDGKIGVSSAGLVGLHPNGGEAPGKIFNIRWHPSFERFGWTGAHTDATSAPFVKAVLSRHIIQAAEPEQPATARMAPPGDDSRSTQEATAKIAPDPATMPAIANVNPE